MTVRNTHQNKPTAPIKFNNSKGQHVLVTEDTEAKPTSLTLKELAVLQTCVNRSYFNCNCDLDKSVLHSIIEKINENLALFEQEMKWSVKLL
jgi:hypothetical protein